MKINWFAIAFIMIVLVVGVSAWPDARNFFTQQNLGPASSAGYGQAKVKFSDSTVIAEVPLSADLQAQGLGGRTNLADGRGMIWIYPKASQYSFWMKDMLISLDFVWIDHGQVVDVTADVPPPQPGQITSDLPILQPQTPASAVLEVPAGFTAAHHVSVGDPVEIDRQ